MLTIWHLLDAHDVFGQLDERASHPRECVGVALVSAHPEPLLGNQVEGAIGIQRHGFCLPVVVWGKRLLFGAGGRFIGESGVGRGNRGIFGPR
jgi:hypothetical protein